MPQFGAYPLIPAINAADTLLMLHGGAVSQTTVSVASLAAMKALSVSGLTTGATMKLLGRTSAGDNGGGDFIYSSSSIATPYDGLVVQPDVGNGRWLRIITSNAIDLRWTGAKGDGVTNDRTSIQIAINFGLATGIPVYVPPTFDSFRVEGAITVYGSNLRIFGCGPLSRIHNAGVGTDAIQFGDDITTYRDSEITGVRITGADASGWGINVRKYYNIKIDANYIDVSSLTGGAINVEQSICSQITRNVIGAVNGTGIKIANASFVARVEGNRIDGISIAQGVGISVNGRAMNLTSNVEETLLRGIVLAGVGGCSIISNYCEETVTAIEDTAISACVIIDGCEFQADPTSLYSVVLNYTNGARVSNNNFNNTHLGGAPVRVVAANGALNIEVGPNQFVDAVELSGDARFSQANIDLVSERKHFRPSDYLRNSFAYWPAGSASAPGNWDNAAVGTLARQSDAAFGRYGLDLIGAGARINRRVMDITATKNASVRGRWVVFSVYAKTISGDDTFRLTITDGINTFTLDNSAAASWGRWSAGLLVSSTADRIEVSVTKLVGGTARFSAPSFYVGTTRPIGSVQDEVNVAPIEVDATVGTFTGSTTEAVVKTATVPARTLGTQGAIRIRASGTASGTNSAKVATLYFGGTLVGQVIEDTADELTWSIDTIIQNTTAAAQVVRSLDTLGTTIYANRQTTITVDTTADVAVELKCDLGNIADSISVKYFSVEPLYNS